MMVAVRDSRWRTIAPVISHETIVSEARSFAIRFDGTHVSDEVDFAWHGSITGKSDGTISFQIKGAPRRRFLRNRIGICVLHPISECAGRDCVVVHSDGAPDDTVFPELISPHQPFLDVHSISHQVLPGIQAKVALCGDQFETEDQRNWTDASFKTYCTPLALSYPVEVGPEDVVEQAVKLSFNGLVEPFRMEPVESRNEILVEANRTASIPHLSVRAADRAVSFVELNRGRRSGSWGIDPRVHADDELTMIENLAGQAPTVRTARSFVGDASIEISPVLVPPIRAMNGWVAISVRELTLAGAASVTYNTEVPFLREVHDFEPRYVIGCQSDAPLLYDAIALKSGNRVRAWIANFSQIDRTIRVSDRAVDVPAFDVRQVDLGSPA
jgi:hypothetical protein